VAPKREQNSLDQYPSFSDPQITIPADKELTLGSGSLPVSPPDPDSVDHESLLGLVSQPPGLVGPRGPGSPVDNRQLPVLPTTIDPGTLTLSVARPPRNWWTWVGED